MARPIVVEISDTGARTMQPPVKKLDPEKLYGNDDAEGISCSELLLYILNPEPDDNNPKRYSADQEEFATRWKSLYDRSVADPNIEVGLMAADTSGTVRPLSLDEKVSHYINETPQSILRTEVIEKDGIKEKYSSLALKIEDLSKGGA